MLDILICVPPQDTLNNNPEIGNGSLGKDLKRVRIIHKYVLSVKWK